MGEKIGDLFVELGITGSDKGKGQVKEFREGIKDTAAASLQMKAAVIGAMYALQQLFSASGKMGTDLKNFSAATGISTQTLQQYQAAARKVGVANQEVESTFASLQTAMTKALAGEGLPGKFLWFADAIGGVSEEDIEAFQKQPQLLIQKLQEYAKAEKNEGLRRDVIESIVGSKGMASAIIQNAFRPDTMEGAEVYSDKQVAALARANAAWSELGNHIEMAIGKFNAKHGEEIVSNIRKIVDSVIKLTEELTKLAEKLKLFDRIKDVADGVAEVVKDVTKAVDKPTKENIEGIFLKPQGPNVEADSPRAKLNMLQAANGGSLPVIREPVSAGAGLLGILSLMMTAMTGDSRFLKNAKPDAEGKQSLDSRSFLRTLSEFFKDNPTMFNNAPGTQGMPPMFPAIPGGLNSTSFLRPSLAVPAGAPQGGNTQNFDIKQTLNFQHPGTDPAKAADSQKKAAKDAWQQSPSRAWGS